MSPMKGFVPMDNNLPETIPYIVHESEMSRLERTVKRLFILCLVLIIVAVGTNAYWIWYELSYEDIVVTQEAETDSGTIHLNGTGTGDIYDNGFEQSDEASSK